MSDYDLSVAVNLMKDFMRGVGIQWEPALHVLPIYPSAVSQLRRVTLLHEMELISVRDLSVYQVEFPPFCNCMMTGNGLSEFESFFHGTIYRRYLDPVTEANFKRYLAYLLHFALFGMMNGFASAPHFAVTTLVHLLGWKPELRNIL